jgi:hypothetical protein
MTLGSLTDQSDRHMEIVVAVFLGYDLINEGKSLKSENHNGFSYVSGPAGYYLFDRQQTYATNGESRVVYRTSSGLPAELKHGAMSWFVNR